MNLTKNCPITLAEEGSAAATSNLTSAAIDTAGLESATFICLVGTITSSGEVELKIQQSSDDGSLDSYADLEDSAVTVVGAANSDKLLIVEIVRPQERYLKAIVTRDVGNSVIGGVIAIGNQVPKSPITDDDTVEEVVTLISPDEGSA